jgi:hypothetical protein
MATKSGHYWITKTRGEDRVEVIRVSSGEFEVRAVTARGDVLSQRFTLAELTEIGIGTV